MDDGFLRCWEKRPRPPRFMCSAMMPLLSLQFMLSGHTCLIEGSSWCWSQSTSPGRGAVSTRETTQNTDKEYSQPPQPQRPFTTAAHSPADTHTKKGSDPVFERGWCHIWYRRKSVKKTKTAWCANSAAVVNMKLKHKGNDPSPLSIIHTCNHLPPWPLTFLVLHGPDGLSGVHRPPQVFPLQIRHTRRLRVLQEARRETLRSPNVRSEAALGCSHFSFSFQSLATFSKSWSCLCIRIFHCSKSSGSQFWMSFRVPSVWMVPSFMAMIYHNTHTHTHTQSVALADTGDQSLCALGSFRDNLNSLDWDNNVFIMNYITASKRAIVSITLAMKEQTGL